jgi:hypothetical protein
MNNLSAWIGKGADVVQIDAISQNMSGGIEKILRKPSLRTADVPERDSQWAQMNLEHHRRANLLGTAIRCPVVGVMT